MRQILIYNSTSGIIKRTVNAQDESVADRQILEPDESLLMLDEGVTVNTKTNKVDPNTETVVPWDNPDHIESGAGYVTPSVKATSAEMGDGSTIVDGDTQTSESLPAGESITFGGFSNSDGVAIEVSGAITVEIHELDTGATESLSLAGGYEDLLLSSEMRADVELTNTGSSAVDVTSVEFHQTG